MNEHKSRITNYALRMTTYLLCLLILTPALPAETFTSPIWSIQFSSDGKQLAVGQYQWVQLWDVEAKKVIHNFEPHADAVRCLRFSSDNKTLLAGGGLAARAGEVRVWNVETEELLNTIELHDDTIESLALSPDGAKLLTVGMDELGFVTTLADGTIEQTLTQHVGRVLAVDYRTDGKYFVTGSEDKSVKVWNPQTYNVLVNLDQNDESVYAVAFAPEENLIVSGSADNAVRSWRITESEGESGQIQTEGSLNRVYNGHQGTVYAVDSGLWQNQMVIVSGSADSSVIVWNLRSGNRLYTFEQPTDEVYAVDLSPDGQFVAAGGRDGIARIWDLADGRLIAEFRE
jgi:WD40 repeat protein